MWWTVLLSIAKKIPWQVYACAGFLLFCFGIYKYGQHTVQLKWDESLKEAKKQTDLFKDVRASVTVAAKIEYLDRLKVIHEKGKTIREQVPIYVGNDLTVLSGNFRLLHDAAVFNTPVGTPFGIYAAPVAVETAALTITDNYEACHINSATLVSLQGWVRAQRQAYLDQCKQQALICS